MHGTFVLVPVLVMLALVAGCGARSREARAEYERQTVEANAIDAQEALAGRDAAAVLEAALAEAGCVWMEGVLFPSENRKVVLSAAYDGVSNQLNLKQYFDYNWSPFTVHRTTSVAAIPLSGVDTRISPPSLGSFKCWTVHLTCEEPDAIRVEKLSQFIEGDTVTEKDRTHERAKRWTVDFTRREMAIDARAALQVLSNQQ